MQLWNTTTGRPILAQPLRTDRRAAATATDDRERGVAFSTDGHVLAAATVEGTVQIWNATTGQARGILKGHRDLVRGMVFSPDDATLITTSWDGTVRLWDLDTLTTVKELTVGPLTSLAVTPTGHDLFMASGTTVAALRPCYFCQSLPDLQKLLAPLATARPLTPEEQTQYRIPR